VSPSAPVRVLIVCTANVIRSPFVEHLLRERVSAGAPELIIDSAGSAARPGRPVEPEAIAIGHRYGLDLGRHRSRRLDESLLEPGTTVLCAAAVHRRVVLDMRPDLLDSTFTLREFARLLAEEDQADAHGSWAALVDSAAHRRTRLRRRAAEDDDLVDPVGQSAAVWADFERCAVDAVEVIAARAGALFRDRSPQVGPGVVPMTRRARRGASRVFPGGVQP
jgi:protein-tyrosine phosphatase